MEPLLRSANLGWFLFNDENPEVSVHFVSLFEYASLFSNLLGNDGTCIWLAWALVH
jgi:hypothetical protein